MGNVHQNGRLTFGFRNVNGKAFQVKITQSPAGTFIDRLTVPTIRNHIVSAMNNAGRSAENIAKSPGWSPYKTGRLVSSIKWASARRSGFANLIIGALTVGVPYGRRQEFEHKSRAFYLNRALAAVQPEFLAELTSSSVLDEIIIGRRKDDRGVF